MATISLLSRGAKPQFLLLLSLCSAALGAGCSSSDDKSPSPATSDGPFQSLDRAANAPEAFSAPRAAVPLSDGRIAFVATVEGQSEADTATSGERPGVFVQPPDGSAPTLLYSGDALVSPLDIDVSRDGATLLIADPAAGDDSEGALLSLSVTGGDVAVALAGNAPRAVTVADDGKIYFSGIDTDSGDVGVFELSGSSAVAVYVGAPLVDPSGIAVLRDGTLLVADTRLFDAADSDGNRTSSEAGIIRIRDGAASVFATGFATGYPAGIALTKDEASLIVSGEAADRSDTVYVFEVGHPEHDPTVVTADFSAFQDASAGLKRAHDDNTFAWASLADGGGTVYRIKAN
jgi:hypothetical protein